jgi:RNA polymerase sigma-70 factor (ECF subfamily)
MEKNLANRLNAAASRFIADRHLLGAFVAGLLRDPHAAEDIIQEVWLQLAKEIENETPIQNQGAWCRAVARNLIRRHWEKSGRGRSPLGFERLEAFLDRVEESFAMAEKDPQFVTARLAALEACLELLPERSKTLLAMKYAEKAALEAIASEVGQTFEAVKKALMRIRAGLQDCVQHRLAMEGWI